MKPEQNQRHDTTMQQFTPTDHGLIECRKCGATVTPNNIAHACRRIVQGLRKG